MTRFPIALLAALPLFVSPSVAQVRTEVVPSFCRTVEGDGGYDQPFSAGPGRTQVLLDPVVLAGLGTRATISALAFRPDGAAGFTGRTVSLELTLSTLAGTAGSPSVGYAGNRGVDATTVFPRTNVVLPTVTRPATPPATGRVTLRFTRTFPWSGGGLCLDLVGHSPAAATPWAADAQSARPAGFGRLALSGTSCPPLGPIWGGLPIPWPGLPVPVRFQVQGTTGIGGALLLLGAGATTWNGLKLPWSLDPLLGTRGCSLYTDIALTAVPGSWTHRAVADLGVLPAAPALAGATLTAQWLLLDPRQPGGLSATGLARTTLGTPPPLVTLYNRTGGTTATAAEYVIDTTPVLHLDVQ